MDDYSTNFNDSGSKEMDVNSCIPQGSAFEQEQQFHFDQEPFLMNSMEVDQQTVPLAQNTTNMNSILSEPNFSMPEAAVMASQSLTYENSSSDRSNSEFSHSAFPSCLDNSKNSAFSSNELFDNSFASAVSTNQSQSNFTEKYQFDESEQGNFNPSIINQIDNNLRDSGNNLERGYSNFSSSAELTSSFPMDVELSEDYQFENSGDAVQSEVFKSKQSSSILGSVDSVSNKSEVLSNDSAVFVQGQNQILSENLGSSEQSVQSGDLEAVESSSLDANEKDSEQIGQSSLCLDENAMYEVSTTCDSENSRPAHIHKSCENGEMEDDGVSYDSFGAASGCLTKNMDTGAPSGSVGEANPSCEKPPQSENADKCSTDSSVANIEASSTGTNLEEVEVNEEVSNTNMSSRISVSEEKPSEGSRVAEGNTCSEVESSESKDHQGKALLVESDRSKEDDIEENRKESELSDVDCQIKKEDSENNEPDGNLQENKPPSPMVASINFSLIEDEKSFTSSEKKAETSKKASASQELESVRITRARTGTLPARPSRLVDEIAADSDDSNAESVPNEDWEYEEGTESAPSVVDPSITAPDCVLRVLPEEMDFYESMFSSGIDAVLKMRLHCTICGRHIGAAPNYIHLGNQHKVLRVLICNRCRAFYGKGKFPKDSDGSELYCRWCGQGGQVLCCSHCPNVFCKGCLRRNFGSSQVKIIEESSDWSCVVCNYRDVWQLRGICWALLKYTMLKKREALMSKDVRKMIELEEDRSKCCGSKNHRKRKASSKNKASAPRDTSSNQAQVLENVNESFMSGHFLFGNLDDDDEPSGQLTGDSDFDPSQFVQSVLEEDPNPIAPLYPTSVGPEIASVQTIPISQHRAMYSVQPNPAVRSIVRAPNRMSVIRPRDFGDQPRAQPVPAQRVLLRQGGLLQPGLVPIRNQQKTVPIRPSPPVMVVNENNRALPRQPTVGSIQTIDGVRSYEQLRSLSSVEWFHEGLDSMRAVGFAITKRLRELEARFHSLKNKDDHAKVLILGKKLERLGKKTEQRFGGITAQMVDSCKIWLTENAKKKGKILKFAPQVNVFKSIAEPYSDWDDDLELTKPLEKVLIPIPASALQGNSVIRPILQPNSTIRPALQVNSAVRPSLQVNSAVRPGLQVNSAVRPNLQMNNTARPNMVGSVALRPVLPGNTAFRPRIMSSIQLPRSPALVSSPNQLKVRYIAPKLDAIGSLPSQSFLRPRMITTTLSHPFSSPGRGAASNLMELLNNASIVDSIGNSVSITVASSKRKRDDSDSDSDVEIYDPTSPPTIPPTIPELLKIHDIKPCSIQLEKCDKLIEAARYFELCTLEGDDKNVSVVHSEPSSDSSDDDDIQIIEEVKPPQAVTISLDELSPQSSLPEELDNSGNFDNLQDQDGTEKLSDSVVRKGSHADPDQLEETGDREQVNNSVRCDPLANSPHQSGNGSVSGSIDEDDGSQPLEDISVSAHPSGLGISSQLLDSEKGDNPETAICSEDYKELGDDICSVQGREVSKQLDGPVDSVHNAEVSEFDDPLNSNQNIEIAEQFDDPLNSEPCTEIAEQFDDPLNSEDNAKASEQVDDPLNSAHNVEFCEQLDDPLNSVHSAEVSEQLDDLVGSVQDPNLSKQFDDLVGSVQDPNLSKQCDDLIGSVQDPNLSKQFDDLDAPVQNLEVSEQLDELAGSEQNSGASDKLEDLVGSLQNPEVSDKLENLVGSVQNPDLSEHLDVLVGSEPIDDSVLLNDFEHTDSVSESSQLQLDEPGICEQYLGDLEVTEQLDQTGVLQHLSDSSL